MARFDAFVGGSYQAQSRNANNERTINFYIERLPGQAKAPAMLCPTPGFQEFATVPEGPIRGIYTLADPESSDVENPRMFFVAGSAFYELFSDGTVASRGVVDFDDNPVQWASNGDAGHQLLVLSAGVVNCFDLVSNVFTASVLTGGISALGLIDGFFLALNPNDSTLHVSDLLNGLVWDPTQIAQRSQASDRWRGMGIAHRQIWLWGGQTSEVWYDAGTYPYPLTSIPDQFFTVGIGAPNSVVLLGDSSELIWLGSTANGRGKVYRSGGLNPTPISTPALEFAIENYGTVDDARAFTFDLNGHSFYVLTFPTEDHTWLYDSRSGLWTEWLYWNQAEAVYESLRVGCHAFGFRKHLVGDRSKGVIYEMSQSFYTDVDGDIIRRVRQAPHLTNEGKVTFYDLFRLDMQVANGVVTGQGSDPRVMMKFSDDGGNTWGPEYSCASGKLGSFNTQVFWNWLGSGRDRVFHVIVADAAPWYITTAYLESRPGTF